MEKVACAAIAVSSSSHSRLNGHIVGIEASLEMSFDRQRDRFTASIVCLTIIMHYNSDVGLIVTQIVDVEWQIDNPVIDRLGSLPHESPPSRSLKPSSRFRSPIL
ncbi:unnamed protein product [Soboliphyme baturini]|uniref:Uncharacterized protein n=1 Tax=Soboliphyme baturini TaxID=241478 RepID=A0A183IBX8_9BILA|nr:unnamed protein product [Soboliphyme baturini]